METFDWLTNIPNLNKHGRRNAQLCTFMRARSAKKNLFWYSWQHIFWYAKTTFIEWLEICDSLAGLAMKFKPGIISQFCISGSQENTDFNQGVIYIVQPRKNNNLIFIQRDATGGTGYSNTVAIVISFAVSCPAICWIMKIMYTHISTIYPPRPKSNVTSQIQ